MPRLSGTKLKSLVREPLLHFLLIGGAAFVVFDDVALDDASADSKRIIVDRESLLGFMQQRARVLEPEGFAAQLDALSDEQRAQLVEDYVREEALYREAKAMQLDDADYGARQRLIGQLRFINEGFVAASIEVSEQELLDYLQAHSDRYSVKPTITFTHVFFNTERHGDESARDLAEAKLGALNSEQVPFHQAVGHGDRFLYHANYVRKEAGDIDSHFGREMQRPLFAAEPDEKTWIGPFRSEYGYHLVLLTTKSAGYLPSLDQVRPRVEADAIQARLENAFEEMTDSIVESYEVELDAALREEADLAASSR